MNLPPLDPRDAERRFARMLDDAGLPRFQSARFDALGQSLELTWDHGLTLTMDLARGEVEPLAEWERAAILGLPLGCEIPPEPIHVVVPGSLDDPRDLPDVPGVIVHRCPPLHPDDTAVVDGIPVTSPSRTLIDMAECSTIDELRDLFARFGELGLLDADALRASRTRVEWRPSLEMLDRVIEEFCD